MRTACSVMVGVVALVASVIAGAQGVVRIDTSGRGDLRTAVAVPDFAAAPGLEAAGREMAQVVANDLVFTGLFVTLPRESYPRTFAGFTPDPSQIDFDAWRSTTPKVTYLMYANVLQQGNQLVAECRMFDVASGTQVTGQRYGSQSDMARLIAHRFSEEVVRNVTSIPGIATSRICFSATIASGKKEIFVSDYDGYNAKQVTQFNSISIKPKFSPDGTKIAYLSYKDRYPFLYVLDLPSGKSTPLSKNVGLNAAPSWSPDSRMLALTLSKDGNTEIYVKNADGSGERRLTRDPGGDTSPTFDPTGRQIAFVSDRGGQPQIYVMGSDGSNARRLSYQGGRACDPVWSPDGKMIAFVVERGGMHIFVMGADGGNPRQLSTSGVNESPSWSPDSRHVIFTSNRTGRAELWAVNVEPPNEEHRISIANMSCEGPSWGPRRQ